LTLEESGTMFAQSGGSDFTTPFTGAENSVPDSGATIMKTHWKNRQGIIKYGIAYLLGVPITLLIVIFLFARGC
jgi:hypothetical protein